MLKSESRLNPFNPRPAKFIHLNFQPLEVMSRSTMYTATHNFKWLKITYICLYRRLGAKGSYLTLARVADRIL